MTAASSIVVDGRHALKGCRLQPTTAECVEYSSNVYALTFSIIFPTHIGVFKTPFRAYGDGRLQPLVNIIGTGLRKSGKTPRPGPLMTSGEKMKTCTVRLIFVFHNGTSDNVTSSLPKAWELFNALIIKLTNASMTS